jgi:hypothetical protein
MNARKNICRGIACVENLQKARKDVAARHRIRAQGKSVRPDCGDDEKNGHAGHHVYSEAVVFSGIVIEQYEIEKGDQHKEKPAQIRENEDLTERNEGIERAVNHVHPAGRNTAGLQNVKSKQVDYGIYGQDPSPLFFSKIREKIHGVISKCVIQLWVCD